MKYLLPVALCACSFRMNAAGGDATDGSVDAVLPFDEAAEALTRLEQRRVKGKLVLRP